MPVDKRRRYFSLMMAFIIIISTPRFIYFVAVYAFVRPCRLRLRHYGYMLCYFCFLILITLLSLFDAAHDAPALPEPRHA